MFGFNNVTYPPGGQVGNMLTWHTVNLDSIPSLGYRMTQMIMTHHNGGPVSLDPQWHVKQPWIRH